ncbi:MAG: YdcH family protein [Sandaracinobacteroides sp.]
MDETELKSRLHALSLEHRDLDAAIEALARQPTADMLQLARLKKRKLRLKDEIVMVQDLLIPDIIA